MIEEIKRRIRNYENQIAQDRANISDYRTKIDEIDQLYQDMRQEKESLSDLKRQLNQLANENYENWQGDIHRQQYIPRVKDQLISGSLTTTIRNVDDNIDALNRAKTEFENRINRTEGVIGHLEGLVNSAWTSIENLMN